MAILPAVGAVAGAVGTVAQMGAAGKSAKNQRAALDEQNRQLTEQHKLLLIQRENQRQVGAAEASRARQMESLAASANLFNIALQEQGATSQRLSEELDLRAQQFQVEQQQVATLSEMYGNEMQTFNQLFSTAQEAQEAQGEIRKVQGEVEAQAAAAGQSDTASSDALAERIAIDAESSFNMANQLFNMMSAQSMQNIEMTKGMAELQAQLGMSDIDLTRMMGDFNRSGTLMQLDATREATLLEQQMNLSAIDAELAGRLASVEAATQADSLNITGAQRLNSIQSQGSSGPGLFEMLPGLVQSGLGVYSAFSPPAALAPRVTNPIYSPPTQQIGLSNLGPVSFDSSRNFSNLPRYGTSRTMSGNVPSLFNIG